MKLFVQNIIILIAAVTVFFTGAGVTIMNYCCTSCSEQTIFTREQHSCCTQDIPNIEPLNSCCSDQEEISHEDSCERTTYTQDKHCGASRLTIDIDASSFRPQVIAPFIWISDALSTFSVSVLPESSDAQNNYALFKSPPEISPPREYLAFIRILII